MKLSYRILLINFVVTALIVVGSSFGFYTIVYNVLTAQQSQILSSSVQKFIFIYDGYNNGIDKDFSLIKNSVNTSAFYDIIKNTDLDFVFTADSDSSDIKLIYGGSLLNRNSQFTTIHKFYDEYPAAIIKELKVSQGLIYYYGKFITDEVLSSFSKATSSEIALTWNNIPLEYSNKNENSKYFSGITEAANQIGSKSSDLYVQGTEEDDIIAAKYTYTNTGFNSYSKEFIIFFPLKETASLKYNFRLFSIILGFCGILLSIILTYLFSGKIIKNINKLGAATESIKNGNFNDKIALHSKDEIGELASAFNVMIDELDKKQKATFEYSDFVSLINQNPSLSQISEAAIKKILNTCSLNVGILYSVDDQNIFKPLAHYGIQKDFFSGQNNFLYSSIQEEEIKEYFLEENYPKINTGLISLDIKYILLIPIYNQNKPIAVMQLGAVNKPTQEAKDYLLRIKEQLAIGLANAFAFVQLENLVNELKKLNEDYQRQNIQIKEQNTTLIQLHNELKLQTEELEIQKQKAEEMTKLKSQFLASMSHELRTPMNSILGLTELILADEEITRKTKERLNVVFKSSKRLMGLINDILDLSKIESGKMDYHKENFCLAEVINEIEQSVNPLFIGKNIQFAVEKSFDENLHIISDRGKITQILTNLLGNAVKFTITGEVKLSVHSINNRIVFKVKDSGIGISEENQQLIFEEFRQVDGTSTRKYSGTGLGLAICKKMTTILNGNIYVNSKVGEGSEFVLEIPLIIGEKKQELYQASDKPVFTGSLFNVDEFAAYKGEILIVDDDPEALFTMNEIVQANGCKTILASSGIDALKLLESAKPNLILLDIMMPEMDGFQVLQKIKENKNLIDIPVYAVTAKAMLEDKAIILRNGFDDYISKPVNAGNISFKISKLLQSIEQTT